MKRKTIAIILSIALAMIPVNTYALNEDVKTLQDSYILIASLWEDTDEQKAECAQGIADYYNTVYQMNSLVECDYTEAANYLICAAYLVNYCEDNTVGKEIGNLVWESLDKLYEGDGDGSREKLDLLRSDYVLYVDGIEIPSEDKNTNESQSQENGSKIISDSEIMFRYIPWGTDYETVNAEHPEYDLVAHSGDNSISPSADGILSNDEEFGGIQFEKTDINIVSFAFEDLSVAGYTSELTELHFAYVPVNGEITGDYSDSSFYGAKYNIEVENLSAATNDIIGKLTSTYGEPDSTYSNGDYDTVTHWYGQNDTELTLHSIDNSHDETFEISDQIVICYAWRGGDDLLQAASDIQAGKDASEESQIYGNGSTDGL